MDLGDGGIGAIPLTIGGLSAIVGFSLAAIKLWKGIDTEVEKAVKPLLERLNEVESSVDKEVERALKPIEARLDRKKAQLAALEAMIVLERERRQDFEKDALKSFVRGEDLVRLRDDLRGSISEMKADIKSDIRHLQESIEHRQGGHI